MPSLTILGGGGFSSRLMTDVREKLGLTYGISSGLSAYKRAGLWIGQVATKAASMRETIAVLRATLKKVAADGPTAKELADAKTYLTGAYPLRFDGNAQIASIMVGMQMDDLPIDYIATRNDKVNAVTLEDVNRVARRLLDPENLHFVIVGKPEGLENPAGN